MNEITNYSTGRRKEQKRRLRSILKIRDFGELKKWFKGNKRVVAHLNSLLFDEEELIQWRAVEAFGYYASELAKEDIEKVKEILRRMLWGMNDESGTLMRRAGEVIAEILVYVPELVIEYTRLLPGHMNIEPFERGVHWGMARVAREYSDIYELELKELKKSIESEDPYIRSMAILALGRDGLKSSKSFLKKALNDPSEFRAYDAKFGRFYRASVADVASFALGYEPNIASLA